MNLERVSVWAEVEEFLTSTPTLERILAFRPSEAMQARVSYLLAANREGTITAEELAELDQHLIVETFMERLKLKALGTVQMS